MEISNEGVIDKIIDIGYRYEEWKNPNKRVDRQPKKVKVSPKEEWYECLWVDKDGGNVDLHDRCLLDLKRGHVDCYGVLFTVLKEKKVTKQQFNVMARKCLKNKETINDTNQCLIDWGDTEESVEHAVQLAKDLMLTVVDMDGFGNNLLYSIKKGEFYDYNHEIHSGANIDTWISDGVKYEEVIK